MKNKHFKLIATFEIDPCGEQTEDIIRRINQSMQNALNNGTITGDSPSTVEGYNFNVIEIKPANIKVQPVEKPRKYSLRKNGEHRFSNPTNGIPRCIDCGCDEDDAYIGGEICTFKRKNK